MCRTSHMLRSDVLIFEVSGFGEVGAMSWDNSSP